MYVPEDGTSVVKYPIANYVSTKNLSQPLKDFSEKMLSLKVPTSVEEAKNVIQQSLEAYNEMFRR